MKVIFMLLMISFNAESSLSHPIMPLKKHDKLMCRPIGGSKDCACIIIVDGKELEGPYRIINCDI
ncbi:hypothetical protein GNP44_01360 [Aliivibrio fischeri]|uniref:Uncharacterized protein n=1 Tax=Aliivibrio fischeri TaxID=668 RepID=A0A510UT01_ALIFS|nr:hypothetical protein [Aliivibrio fischeri]MUK28745.1 hypothetical protein [Aliivibrio fischeri]MUK66856.1 hypothetical protein [Aliivibrio fischeri]GEK15965.1 hypothetical protein AFI02nite_40010 [Aliivibrio fischeri]